MNPESFSFEDLGRIAREKETARHKGDKEGREDLTGG
jgi:hypothetical protein